VSNKCFSKHINPIISRNIPVFFQLKQTIYRRKKTKYGREKIKVIKVSLQLWLQMV